MTSFRRTLAAALVAAPALLLVAQPAAARDNNWNRDVRGPVVSHMTPDHGNAVADRGRIRVAAHFHDNDSGIASVRLRLNGRDVTRESRITGNQIRYMGDLAPGRYRAEITVRDRAGNTTRQNWLFAVHNRGGNLYSYRHPGQRW